MHIRRGRITREDAVEIVNKNDGLFPWSYLGKPLKDILEPLDLTVEEFIEICDSFTNKKIFKTDRNGNLVKEDFDYNHLENQSYQDFNFKNIVFCEGMMVRNNPFFSDIQVIPNKGHHLKVKLSVNLRLY